MRAPLCLQDEALQYMSTLGVPPKLAQKAGWSLQLAAASP